MTLKFTDKEKRFLTFDLQKEYPFGVKEDAPEEIKESINEKIKAHKEWLKSMTGDGDK